MKQVTDLYRKMKKLLSRMFKNRNDDDPFNNPFVIC